MFRATGVAGTGRIGESDRCTLAIAKTIVPETRWNTLGGLHGRTLCRAEFLSV